MEVILRFIYPSLNIVKYVKAFYTLSAHAGQNESSLDLLRGYVKHFKIDFSKTYTE